MFIIIIIIIIIIIKVCVRYPVIMTMVTSPILEATRYGEKEGVAITA